MTGNARKWCDVRLTELFTLERPLVSVDCETTNTNRQKARIVELGLEIIQPDGAVKEYSTRINPGEPIPPESTAIHHITDADVQQAPMFKDLAANLLRGFSNADFIGYNVRFDLDIISAEFARCGHTWDYDGPGVCVIDGYRLWQLTFPRELEDFLKACGVQHEGPHVALHDAKAASRGIAAWLALHPQLPRTLKDLHALCIGDRIDAAGKLKRRGDQIVFNFGDHRDESLMTVPLGYLRWVCRRDFSALVKQHCRDAIAARTAQETTHAPDQPSTPTGPDQGHPGGESA